MVVQASKLMRQEMKESPRFWTALCAKLLMFDEFSVGRNTYDGQRDPGLPDCFRNPNES
jgi:hypothetical protein